MWKSEDKLNNLCDIKTLHALECVSGEQQRNGHLKVTAHRNKAMQVTAIQSKEESFFYSAQQPWKH